MAEKVISFVISNKNTTIPIHKVLNNEGLITPEFLVVKDLKGTLPLEYCLQSSKDSSTLMKPFLFRLIKPVSYQDESAITADSFAIFFFEGIKIDCKRIKLELKMMSTDKNNKDFYHFAELHYKTLDQDGNYEKEPLPVISNLQWK